MEGAGEGKCDVFVHLSSTAAGYWGGKVLVVHVPIDSRWVSYGGIAYAEGASRDGLGVIYLEVGDGGGGGLPDKEGNASFSGVFREGREDKKGVGDGAKGKDKGVVGAVYLLQHHNVDWGKKSMEIGDFGFLAGGIVMKEGATVPGGDADGLNGEFVGGGAWQGVAWVWARVWV